MREDFVEAVLSAVELIPPGQVASYGDLAEYVGSGGPRQIGSVMSHYGGAVCWWRVVRADGRPADGLEVRALQQLRAEGAPIRGDRVIMKRARWRGPSASDGSGE
ncbi:MGMT family protein [Microlunatus elymi]|uniref:MGMT family protein n=1 Tax=Microlunatus elymi TaxID=2596828 RepID=UPI001D194ECE|nr:MGMT family protein [Microlunatus elymi]